MLLKNQVAIVTGASSIISSSVAKTLASEGATILLLGRDAKALNDINEQIEAAGGQACPYPCDFGDEEQMADTVAAIQKKYGRIDVLINIIGAGPEGLLVETPVTDWDIVIRNNLRNVMVTTKLCLPTMVEQHSGSVILIGEGTPLRGKSGKSAHSAALAASLCFMQAIGDELRPDGVRCNTICFNPATEEASSPETDVVCSDSVAQACLFLVSALSEGMSSQVITLSD